MAPEPTIVDVVHAWFEAASRGDPAAIDSYVSTSPFTRLVGSDPDEWLHRGEEIAAFLRAEVGGAAGAVTFTPSETEAFAVGDVGWAATKLTIALSDGKRVTPRWTAVFVRNAVYGGSCRPMPRSRCRTIRSAGRTSSVGHVIALGCVALRACVRAFSGEPRTASRRFPSTLADCLKAQSVRVRQYDASV